MTNQFSQSETRASLLLKIRDADDNNAWKEFVKMYYPMIYRWATKKGIQDSLAEEITQQVLYRVAQSIGNFQYENDRGSFRGWLYTVTRREAMRLLQKEKKIGEQVSNEKRGAMLETISSEHQDPRWDEEFNQHICATALSTIQSEFDEQTWSAFELVWKHEQRPADVAAQLQRPTAWVYKAKFRVLERLKKEVLYLAEDALFIR